MDATSLTTSKPSRPRFAIGLGIARGLAAFLGGFSLVNLAGELWHAGFDANEWWIDFRAFPVILSEGCLVAASVLLLAYAVRPSPAAWRRFATLGLVVLLLLVAVQNMVQFGRLAASEAIRAGMPVPFSLLVAASLVMIGVSLLRRHQYPLRWLNPVVAVLVLLVSMVVFPLGQMLCFGKTDYRRPADAVVVLGARTYADGRPSDALADRVRTGCQLYLDGLAKTVIFSGGPGDGAVHETEAMQAMAVGLGVPEEAIVRDTEGLNTRATVANTVPLFEQRGLRRVLVVSHFYHLPRIKMSYQRAGIEVYTVPAKESYTLTWMPFYILREVAGLWVYYLDPLR